MEAIANETNMQNELRIADGRRKIAAKIVMALTDKLVNDVVRPGPAPEERECYEVAGEVRALGPELEELVKRILDTEGGVE
jgi:hypothetical protein